MGAAADGLLAKLDAQGWRGRVVPIGRLADLRDAIERRHAAGLFDERLFREQLGDFAFEPPAELPEARSILVVAVPTPQIRVVFHRRGERVPVVVPPTYVSYTPRTTRVQGILASWLRDAGYRLAPPELPLKTLAVCSGLAAYGRNNLCYVPGMGSFLQLVGAYSDLPCESDPWQEPVALARCGSCRICRRVCPTAAIGDDRFLLHTERCLTYHDESPQDFPDWIDPSWVHCLVGCMRCQAACPEDRPLRGWFEDRAEFSEEETALLLRQVPPQRFPAETAAKLKGLELNSDYRQLCRNLTILLGRDGGPA